MRDCSQCNIYASLPSSWAARFISEEHGLNQVDYYCILALHMNQDWNGVREQLGYRSKALFKIVHKFHPGNHYHVMGEKFDRLDQAIQHIKSEGFQYGGIEETFTYMD